MNRRRLNNYKIIEDDYKPDFGYEEPQDVPKDEFESLEGEINNQDNKSKRNKKVIAIAVALSLAAGSVVTYLGYNSVLEKKDFDRANDLTNDFKSGTVCLIPERIFTYQNHDFEYTTGKHLVEALTKKHIGIFRVGDQFVTPNGERVAKVQLEIIITKAKPIQYYEVDGQSFYVEPYGYTWNGTNGQCETEETEIIERYVYANSDHYYYETPVPNSRVKEVLSVEEYDSISYEEAEKMHLIADVNDEYVNSTSEVCNIATLRLVPNNKNN